MSVGKEYVLWIISNPIYRRQPIITMGSTIRILAALLTFLAVGVPFHGAAAAVSPGGTLRAGAAKVDITPDSDPPLAGYGARWGSPSKGVHDPIYARALVLDNGHMRVAICNMDLVITTIQLRKAILERLEEIEPNALLLFATHNHSGVGGYVDNFLAELVAMGPYDENTFGNLADGISQAVMEASANLRPATIGWTRTAAPDLCTNRRARGGRVDPDIGVLRVMGQDGEPIAILVNFAAHPTILGPENMLISGDFPGFLARFLEEGAGVVLFANGASADIEPRLMSGGNGFEVARAFGESLGQRVLQVLDEVDTKAEVRIAAMEREIPLPFRPDLGPNIQIPLLTRCLNVLADIWLPEKTVLEVIAIDDLLFIGVPCDLGAEVGLGIKASVTPRWGFIISQANDYIGYVISRDQYREGGYEAKMSFFGPDLAALIKGEVLGMLQELDAQ